MSGSGPITTIVADFGGVLSTPLWDAFAHVQAEFGIEADALGRAMALAGERRGENPLYALETGRVSEADFAAEVEAALVEVVGRPVGMDRFHALYWEALGANDELVSALRERRAEGYRMGLLTNNVREWEPRWRAMLPVDELFSVVVDSAFVGVRKPDPEIYRLTEERLGVPGSEIVFLDDFERNCDAARERSWTAIRFEDTAQTLRELDAVLSRSGAPGVGPGSASA